MLLARVEALTLTGAVARRQVPILGLSVIASVVLPDEFHITVPHLNLSRSLRYLFDAPQ